MPTPPTPTAEPVALTAAVRTGVALLALSAFALSYDALRQMAAASQIHPALTYAFPLVIDGFIAIGIGALLVLRATPLPSRLYIWSLVGLATATSIWANVLHAVRLNQQTRHTGLTLGDITVGTISAIPPLALAGAVHLYLLMGRRHVADNRHNEGHTPAPRTISAPTPATSDATEPEARAKPQALPARTGAGHPPILPLDEAVAIGRTAPLGRGDRVSRRNVEQAIRAKGFGISRSRLDEVKDTLQSERDAAVSAGTH
ncbi:MULTISPECIES: DUF2637 domain-containing protein [Streptomyces]|uniref:DUF2637 domain-containing protein n=1 Tax=Streptomyces evansiae TaxID=3075535 RepID=A0ABU2QY68_9ACTN|nr:MULTISPECIES: DUF2637 domain-containing protein [unclassified Streptomyces]MDT0409392.1 DUF2637 domain-containing protein [Streptomyces sp. DSM 41979]MYQ59732.1 DUF2637 domain-containing protein [Streptomyces sp. SID4926]SCE60271.1 Protein of unknown function [Streptomyces sp. DfronAA-171]